MKDEKTECGIRTDGNPVPFEIAPVELLLVRLDQGPVFSETVETGGDLDRLGVKHEADDTLIMALSDLAVELVTSGLESITGPS